MPVLATPRTVGEELVPPDPRTVNSVNVAQVIIQITDFLREVGRRINSLLARTSTLEERIVLTQTVAVAHKSADYTMNPGDCIVIGDATGGDITITLPRAQDVAGRVFYVKKIDGSANLVRIEGYGSETVDEAANANATVQYESFTVVSDGVEWWIV